MKVGKYTIRWRYHRYHPRHKLVWPPLPSTDEDLTTCIIVDDEGLDAESNTARCHPSDNFSRDTGRRLSLARCMHDMKIPKEDRKMIWEAYRNMTPKKRW